jgi:hypothetical protein
MTEKITVFVDDKAVPLYRGMQVKHALIAYDYSLYTAVQRGEILMVDQNGFRLSLEGALQEGSRIFTRLKPAGPSPSG